MTFCTSEFLALSIYYLYNFNSTKLFKNKRALANFESKETKYHV